MAAPFHLHFHFSTFSIILSQQYFKRTDVCKTYELWQIMFKQTQHIYFQILKAITMQSTA
jgi:hypothetical protein